MLRGPTPLAALQLQSGLAIGIILLGALFLLLFFLVLVTYGRLWLQAYLSDARVSMLSLVGMSFRQIQPSMIVTAMIMGRQAGLEFGRRRKTSPLEAHALAGGDVMGVVRAIIVAHRAGINLDFDRAAAIDLAGRDVLDAVRISVSPKVIDCPDPTRGGKTMLSAIAMNGVELLVRARVTVRMNLDQLIGGATEETIVARVGQGIVSVIGSASTHMEVLALPNQISRGVLDRGLDANTAFEIVSIDIAELDVGENVGARLQADQADADMRVAQARAEVRRADAIAYQQEMMAKVKERQSMLLLAEAEVPVAVAAAFRAGRIYVIHNVSPARGVQRNPKQANHQHVRSPLRGRRACPPRSMSGKQKGELGTSWLMRLIEYQLRNADSTGC